MRKEVVNTFSDGLISDLNPINTPATALTDCLNGTLITYDGNEFSLQNDKGNKKLKYSQLPNNYVPVGTTEYGDILYIVAYNPINNKVQVGSFPSPQTIWDTDTNKSLENPSILTQESTENDCIWEDVDLNKDEEIQYSYNKLLDKHSQLKIFYDKDDGEFKIYPGDMYQLSENEIETTNWPDLEKLKFFILDDNKVLHDITKEIETRHDPIVDSGSNEEYYYVSWQVPGYLAYKWDLPQIQNYELRPKTVIVTKNENDSENPNAQVYVNTQIESSDPMMESLFENEKIHSQINKESDLISNDKDVYSDQVFYNASNQEPFTMTSENNRIKIVSVPKLVWEDGKYIIYDHFKTSKEINLKDLFSEDTTEFGSYTYLVKNREDKTCVVTVNQELKINIVAQGEIIMDAYCTPFINVINNGYQLDDTLSWEQCGKNLYEGQGGNNVFELHFPHEEDIYIVKYHLTDQPSVQNSGFDKYCLIIASEIMNDFEDKVDNYADIKFSQWFPKVNQIIIEPEFEVGNLTESDNFFRGGLYDEDYWESSKGENKALFVKEGDPALTKTDTFKRGFGYTFENIKATFEEPKTALYNFFNFNRTYTGNFEGKDVQTLTFTNGKTTVSSNGEYETMIGAEIEFKPVLGNLVNVLPTALNSTQTIADLYIPDNNENIWDKVITIDAYRHVDDSKPNKTCFVWNVFDYEPFGDNYPSLIKNIRYKNQNELTTEIESCLPAAQSLINQITTIDHVTSDEEFAFSVYDEIKTLGFYANYERRDGLIEKLVEYIFVPGIATTKEIISLLNDDGNGNITYTEDSLRTDMNSDYVDHNTTKDSFPEGFSAFIQEQLNQHSVPCMPARISVVCPGDNKFTTGKFTKFADENGSNSFQCKENNIRFMWGIIFMSTNGPMFVPIKNNWYNWNETEEIIPIYRKEYRDFYKNFFNNVYFSGSYVGEDSLESGYFLRKRAGETKEVNELVATLILNSTIESIELGSTGRTFDRTLNDLIAEKLKELDLSESNFGGNIITADASLYKDFPLDIGIELSAETEGWPYRNGAYTDYEDAGIDDLIEINDAIVAKSNEAERKSVNEASNTISDINSGIGFTPKTTSNKSMNSLLTMLSTHNYNYDINASSYQVSVDSLSQYITTMWYGTNNRSGNWNGNNTAKQKALMANITNHISKLNETEA